MTSVTFSPAVAIPLPRGVVVRGGKPRVVADGVCTPAVDDDRRGGVRTEGRGLRTMQGMG